MAPRAPTWSVISPRALIARHRATLSSGYSRCAAAPQLPTCPRISRSLCGPASEAIWRGADPSGFAPRTPLRVYCGDATLDRDFLGGIVLRRTGSAVFGAPWATSGAAESTPTEPSRPPDHLVESSNAPFDGREAGEAAHRLPVQ